MSVLTGSHFIGVSCTRCGHAVYEHANSPCCRVCFDQGLRGRSLCQRDEKCPVDGVLASKHEGDMTGDQLSIDDALGDVIPSRNTDPETSHAAAREIRVKAGSQRAWLLRSFARLHRREDDDGGLTDEEAMLWAAPFVSATSEYAKRCSELREGGYIEPTGETRPGSAGPQRIVSRITDKGRAWVETNR